MTGIRSIAHASAAQMSAGQMSMAQALAVRENAGGDVVTTLTCAYFYVFEQDWLLTLIYRDFTGFAYLGYLAVVFAFLCDIVMNGAAVTSAR